MTSGAVRLRCVLPELFLQYLRAICSVRGNMAGRLAELQRCLGCGALVFNCLSKRCLGNFIISSSVSNELSADGSQLSWQSWRAFSPRAWRLIPQSNLLGWSWSIPSKHCSFARVARDAPVCASGVVTGATGPWQVPCKTTCAVLAGTWSGIVF